MGTPGWEGSRQEDSCFLHFRWFSHALLLLAPAMAQHVLGLTRGCSNVPLPAGPTAPTSNQQENPSKCPGKATLLHLSVTTAEHWQWQQAINFQEQSLLTGQDSRNAIGTVGMAPTSQSPCAPLLGHTCIDKAAVKGHRHPLPPDQLLALLRCTYGSSGMVTHCCPPSLSPEPSPRARICPPSHEASLTEESLLLTHPSFPLFSSNTSDHPVPGQSTSIRGVDQDP